MTTAVLHPCTLVSCLSTRWLLLEVFFSRTQWPALISSYMPYQHGKVQSYVGCTKSLAWTPEPKIQPAKQWNHLLLNPVRLCTSLAQRMATSPDTLSLVWYSIHPGISHINALHVTQCAIIVTETSKGNKATVSSFFWKFLTASQKFVFE